ncbi:radical SAM protein [Arthrobacter sp. 260]|uniref:radical SAM protein n=1 Tax=Arthrobacter sp. 260 TaxID=2735314 RepID=UPI001491AE8A|nr:radical SAM protein [Arthrobacter sp. 260]NOJ58428.1 radical SAM protein [Arthrobacter sp. 260]
MRIRLGPDGMHLFDRQSGLNVLLDEVAPSEHAWSSAPRQVSIAVTNACDLACSYCYAPKHHAVLDMNYLLSWMDELDQAGALGIGFGGGEPTLYRHLPEVCAHAAENTDLAVTMTTHGHRFNADLISRLRGTVNFVRVSVDGVGNTYERLRGRSFADLRVSLDAIAADFQWGMNSVINQDTVADLDAIAALAEAHGASELLLLPEQPTAGTPGVEQKTLHTLENWVLSYTGPVPLATSADAALGVPIADALPGEVGLRSYAHIDASGTARTSSYASSGVCIGDDGVMAALKQLVRMEAA